MRDGHGMRVRQSSVRNPQGKIRRHAHWLLLLWTLALPGGRSACAASCEGLASLELPDTTITSAVSVTPPYRTDALPFFPPVEVTVPFCRVAATLTPTRDSNIKIEVWLPLAASWNEKFAGVGNAGLGGSILTAYMVPDLVRGYVTAATDTGHDNSGAPGAFALGHPEKVIDYGYRSTHLTAVAGKAIAEKFYGRAAQHAYFSGCSQGGQEAMMEAQRFPADYDGIIAGDPDYYQTHHEVGAHLWMMAALFGNPAGAIPPSKASLVGHAVNEACDALDGVRDGVLEDPRQCRFDPGVLQCKGADSPDCLTAPQVEAIRKIWEGPSKATGLCRLQGPGYYPGLERGGEADTWARWIATDSPETNLHGYLGMPFFKYFVFADPNWNFRAFDYKVDPARVEKKLAAALDATDPNLEPFARRGGKLIHYHGYSDPDIPPRASILYYESVIKALGGRAKVNAFYRLFMVPGMGHCFGGPGASSFDTLTALERWVEQGAAPETLVATKYADTANPSRGIIRTHPLCSYPATAHYVGTGSTDEAQNFVCRLNP